MTEEAYLQQITQALKPQIQALLAAGHALTVRWSCGGDESFVYTALDGTDLPPDYGNDLDLSTNLDYYLTYLLELPSAGEFHLEGAGRIFQDGPELVIEYQSEASADTSWMDALSDEELADIGYTRPAVPTEAARDEEEDGAYPPDPEMSAAYTGRTVLFTLV